MKNIEIKKVIKSKNINTGQDCLEVEFLLDGVERTECFVGSDYWSEIVAGEERWEYQLKENMKNLGTGIEPVTNPEEDPDITIIKKHGGKTYEI